MRLYKARVQNYRSIIDTGEFEIERLKTILVGPNEAGKTVILQALQQLNSPKGLKGFDALRDYPRSKYNDISKKRVDPDEVRIVTGWFTLDDEDKAAVPKEFHDAVYKSFTNLSNKEGHSLENAPKKVTYEDVKSDLIRLGHHTDKQFEKSGSSAPNELKPSLRIIELLDTRNDDEEIDDDGVKLLKTLLDSILSYIEEGNRIEEDRKKKLYQQLKFNTTYKNVLSTLASRMPVFVLFNNYFRVKPSIHLERLANRIDQNSLDDESYDYGNICLLKYLGFTARQLSNLGYSTPPSDDQESLEEYKRKLDERGYQLNAASVQLTGEINSVWMPNPNRPEADKLKVLADSQYLKVVVEDDLGVDIELDQRSEGYQWLVSFFIVFFAEASEKHSNAILLLDEPGMSLHGLKQRDFRETINRLALNNQVIFTTHSPFLVGPDELDLVRVVEMKSRLLGTTVHTTLSSSDPAGLLPLQEAFGYDLAQSLFSQQRNLILEGLTDYWFIEATSELFKASGYEGINDRIALVFANSAGKVVYYATILHAHHLKVAALLDSDAAGDQAAEQEHLVHALGNKHILRTKDFVTGIPKAEIEDLLRDTLVGLVIHLYNVDTTATALTNVSRPIVDIFKKDVPDFAKYKLAKEYVRWTRDRQIDDLSIAERSNWETFFQHVNRLLK